MVHSGVAAVTPAPEADTVQTGDLALSHPGVHRRHSVCVQGCQS